MNLVRFALKHTYTICAIAIAIAMIGALLLPRIPADILPDFKTPVIVSFFSYQGLPSEEMEKSVSSRVERALTLAGGLEHQESRTMAGAALLKIYFQPGTNPSAAMNDIVNLEASDMFHLPPGIEYPFTMRSEPANLPVILAAISGDGLSETELYKIGYYAVRNKMGGLKGVQIPHPFGGKFRQMMIYVDADKLRAHQLSPRDVVQALHAANLVMAGGSVKMGDSEYQIHTVNTLPTPADIDMIPITTRGGKAILIRDVGYTKDDASMQFNIVRVNGVRSVYCPLLREPGRNTIQVVDSIKAGLAKEIPLMKERGDIPEATKVTLVSDQSHYIRSAIRNLTHEVLLGALLVSLVVLLFLRRLVPAIAIILTIPLSLLTGLLGFYFSGHTINVMTLGGIALAVGTVVDAGIVVVENIVRHLNMGKTPVDAARDGSTEVAGPVLAGTITTVAVFIPVIFLSGMIRYLFEPMSVAACTTIAASYVIAMTIVPVFCARFLRQKISKTPATVETGAAESSGGLYDRCLGIALRVPALVIIGAVLFVGATVMLIPHLGQELFPDVDAGTFEIRLKTRPGTRLEATERLVERVEKEVQQVIKSDDLDTVISNIGMPVGKAAGWSTIISSNSGPDTAFIVVNLKQDGRKRSTSEYVGELRTRLQQAFPQEQFLFVTGGIINAALNEGVAAPIDIQISAGSLEKCRAAADEIVAKVREIPGTADVQIAQMLDTPQIEVEVDRIRAASLGLSQREIAENVVTALGSSIGYAPTIWIDPKSGTDFFMGVQFESNELESLDELRNLPLSITTPDGPTTVPLSSVATLSRKSSYGEIAHYDIARINNVYVNIEGRDLGSVVTDVEKVLSGMQFGSGVTAVVRGPVRQMQAGARSLGLGLAAAAILVYLVMMAQFRSLLDPLIIMLAVPLGISGVALVLYFTGTSLNIQSLVGTLMMIGVVVNNSILLVDFANEELARGASAAEAALAAARIRLRPILMTAFVLIASMAPLSVKLAPGSEAMVPLARALIGGMLVSTFLTLFLVPCVYALVKSKKKTDAPPPNPAIEPVTA